MKQDDTGNQGTMTSAEVAEYLAIPLVAVGQLVFDGKLEMVVFDAFRQVDVERLLREEPGYLERLR